MTNLLDNIKSYLSAEIISQAAHHFGENESGVGKAAAGLIPTILAGILKKTGDAAGMDSIYQMLHAAQTDVLDHPGQLLSSGHLAQHDPKDASGHLMSILFGHQVPAINNAIAAFAGVQPATASSLLGFVGPLVMGVLGKSIHDNSLNAEGLANLLRSEQQNILALLPGGMSALLGLAKAQKSEPSSPVGNRGWLRGILLLLAMGIGILLYMRQCIVRGVEKDLKGVGVALDSSMHAVGDALKATQEATNALKEASQALSGFMKKLPSGKEVKGNAEGIENQLIAFIESDKPVDKTTWFNFDRLLFATNSAEIDMNTSKDQLTNMVDILNAYPKVKLRIGGYTDNTGSEAANLKLSKARADAVVQYLVGQGIAQARLSAEGYGSRHPVAGNDTEEGRAQNRRIAVRVTEK